MIIKAEEKSRLRLSELTLVKEPENPTEKLLHEVNRDLQNANRSNRKQLTALFDKKSDYEFSVQINKDISNINHLINNYNLASTLEEKRTILTNISSVQFPLDKYPDRVIINSPICQNLFFNQLWLDIKQQNQTLSGIEQLPPNSFTQSFNTNDVILTDLIAEMAPEKIAKMSTILFSNRENQKLTSLYSPDEPGYERFQSFLQSHSISFLGGTNSRNFKVTDTAGHSQVLKVDNRMGDPKSIAEQLKDTMDSSIFASDLVTRRCFYKNQADTDNGTLVLSEHIGSLVVKDYCNAGNLLEDAAIERTFETKLERAMNIYQQMANILVDLEEHHGVFPDMKNDNWLLQNDRLQIADDKSLRVSNSDGMLDAFTDSSQWYGEILASAIVAAPEVNEDAPFRADKMHAFGWGKMLYQFLSNTGGNIVHDANELNFDFPIFELPQGRALKDLIEKTVLLNPNDRISIADVRSQLKEIQLLIPQNEDTVQKFKQLKTLFSTINEPPVSVDEKKSEKLTGYGH